MSKKRKIISTILIIVGIAIAAFPIYDRVYAYYWQQKLLSAFEEDLALEIDAPETLASDFIGLEDIYNSTGYLAGSETSSNPDASSEDSSTTETSTASSSTVGTTEKKSTTPDKSVVAKIRIKNIDVLMPVLNGATEKNLNRGAAIITGSSKFGEVGNVAIAGHRGRSYGVFFNRLDEIKNGDIIEVITKEKHYKYTVYKVHRVEPDDVSVLNSNGKDKILTLVTCDPVKNPTHRLIVHALQNP